MSIFKNFQNLLILMKFNFLTKKCVYVISKKSYKNHINNGFNLKWLNINKFKEETKPYGY